MHLAFTYNLRTNDSEEQAEYDSPATIKRITKLMKSLGHSVTGVELSQPIERVVRQLRASKPELIFNISEGSKGRLREAFWPAVFAELGIPFTGSDGYALAITLDKQLTKEVVKRRGVVVPEGVLVQKGAPKTGLESLRFPVIVKPNFEGSSKGVRQNNIAEDQKSLARILERTLRLFPDGVLVEEYIVGRDITVPVLEAAGGILDPIEYVIDPAVSAKRKYHIYDYELKNDLSDHVDVALAELGATVKTHIIATAAAVVKAVDCRDLGRMDFRLTPDGRLYFLEINCLPSLEDGAGIFRSAAARGIDETGLIDCVIKSAVKRYGLVPKSAKQTLSKLTLPRRRQLSVAGREPVGMLKN